MQVKDRIIQIEKDESSSNEKKYFIVDEFGIEGEHVYHRRIAISEDVYDAFEKDPDHQLHLGAFLQRHDINSKWERYEANKKKYSELSERETLIHDPLILDVFNEALRDDAESTHSDNVFPFFDDRLY